MEPEDPRGARPLARCLNLLTWNLGYGGLGAASEFISDGGTRLRIEDAGWSRRWMSEIAAFVAKREENALLFQEAARPSYINHGCDLWGALCRALPAHAHSYAHEYRIPLPFGFGIETACANFHRGLTNTSNALHRLPSGGNHWLRQYPVLATRFEFAGAPFTVMNAHLSAFDPGARLRARQLAALLALAAAEYAAGRHVVVGADFNYELEPRPRPHTTDMKHMAWLHAFPLAALPPGWRVVADAATPTFRSGDKPYVRGGNYCGIIDGFIVAPNVEVVNVSAIDLDFAASDHNPVRLTVNAQ
jgi:endonuclease/exonuclease/phosphatase family metal-dependent hydrolase